MDGCPLNCAAHTLKLAGFQKFDHLELHKIGIRKGSCPVNEERIVAGVAAAKKILANEMPAVFSGRQAQIAPAERDIPETVQTLVKLVKN